VATGDGRTIHGGQKMTDYGSYIVGGIIAIAFIIAIGYNFVYVNFYTVDKGVISDFTYDGGGFMTPSSCTVSYEEGGKELYHGVDCNDLSVGKNHIVTDSTDDGTGHLLFLIIPFVMILSMVMMMKI
jgi:hypothetical protein